jgi:hypothetical protein
MSICINNSITNCANFKGSVKKNENGVPYYHSTSGTRIGGIAAIAGALGQLDWLLESPTKPTPSNMKICGISQFDVEKILERNRKMAIPSAIATAVGALGCGMLIDYIRNNNAKKAANQIASTPLEKTIEKNSNIGVSENGKQYYKSKVGSKYGFALGAGCGILSMLKTPELIKTPVWAISKVAFYTIGGGLLGLLADHNTNKQASNNL